MSFTPTQIFITFISFFATLVFAYWWHTKDKKSENRQSDVESFPVLMSVFFWAVFLSLILKMLIDLGVYYAPGFFSIPYVEYGVLFFEDLVKVAALLVGVNIAGKRFNELSDGVVYAVFATLGFVFFENVFYLLSTSPNWADFVLIFLSRNIFSFAAHLSIVIFGLFYAMAYLRTDASLLKKLVKRKESRVAPYHVGSLLKFLWDKYFLFTPFILPFLPFILIVQFFRGQKSSLIMSELLLGGFLFSYYIHVLYDFVLNMNIAWLNTLTLATVGIFMVILFHRFPKIDIK